MAPNFNTNGSARPAIFLKRTAGADSTAPDFWLGTLVFHKVDPLTQSNTKLKSFIFKLGY
jgi:hypothetical protein